MLTFVPTAVDAEPAATLLGEYFTSRELGFTGGTYQVFTPDPALFTPPAGVFLVAEEDGVAVGCGGVRRIADADADDGAVRLEVKHLWVRPSTRGKGYGRAVLAALEDAAVALGATRLVLDTNASLEAAAGLYRAAGYRGVPAYNDNPNATNWYAKDV